MDDWITNYYDVPESVDCVTAQILIENNSNSVSEHHKPRIKYSKFEYQSDNFDGIAYTKIDLEAA